MNAIVAVTQDWGIGRDNELLVRISPDLRRFKALTWGKTVILGRRTLQSMPGGVPLKGRETIVLSRSPDLDAGGARICRSVEELQRVIKEKDPDSLFVIGGESVYRALLPYCSQVYVTQVRAAFPADRFFPNLDELPDWRLEEAGPWQTDGETQFRYAVYRRTSGTQP